MSADIYDRISELADFLANSGKIEDSDAVRNAVAHGSTGTEILMSVRFEIDRLLQGSGLSERELILAKTINSEIKMLLA